MIHELKIGKEYLKRLMYGTKKAEIRYNDRDYQVGDVLKFYNITKDVSPGDDDFWVLFEIRHIHSGLGMKEGYVCLSVNEMKPH